MLTLLLHIDFLQEFMSCKLFWVCKMISKIGMRSSSRVIWRLRQLNVDSIVDKPHYSFSLRCYYVFGERIKETRMVAREDLLHSQSSHGAQLKRHGLCAAIRTHHSNLYFDGFKTYKDNVKKIVLNTQKKLTTCSYM